MGARSSYKGLYLEQLRERVISAYYRNRRFENTDDKVIDFPNNHRNKHYQLFIDDIFNITKVLISNGVIFKLLYFKNQNDNGEYVDRRFDTTIIEAFEKYANTIQTPQGRTSGNIIGNQLKGALLIDSAFKNRMQSDEFVPKKTDFYSAKKDNDCQWRGIARNWDCPRIEREKIKDHVIDSFNWESRVAAVIRGCGGCGKSTFLRRLAIDCINENFKVLWINDLWHFCDSHLFYNNDDSEKYLLFIDDWTAFEDDIPLTSKFLSRIQNVKNVRVVIGDRNSATTKKYWKYTVGNGLFELVATENERIIKHILGINRGWQQAASNIFSTNEIKNAPLFLILFVLARESEQVEYSDTKDIESLFTNIMENDYELIHDAYPGLAQALYYYSCLYNEYKDRALITWQSFLKLAECYNKSSTICNRFSQLNNQNPISRILSHYISLETLIHPELPDTSIIRFHHDLLVQQGLTKSIKKEWHFDTGIKAEILTILIEKGEVDSATTLYFAYVSDVKQTVINDIKRRITDYPKFDFKNSLDLRLKIHHIVQKLYDNVGANNDEMFWKWGLREFAIYLSGSVISVDCVKIVVETLIEKGCKDRFILSVHEKSLNNTEEFLLIIMKRVLYDMRIERLDKKLKT